MPADQSKKSPLFASDFNPLSRFISERKGVFHIPRDDGMFIPQQRFTSEPGMYFSKTFASLIVENASTEISRPTDIRILDFDKVPRMSYDNLGGLLDMDLDLDLYHVRWLLDNHGNQEDGAFSIESRNIIPFEGSVIIIMHIQRRKNRSKAKKVLTTDAASSHDFKLRQGDRLLQKRPHL